MASPLPRFSEETNRVSLDGPKTYHIPDWDHMDDRRKMAVMRQIVEQYGRDPRITEKTMQIIRQAGVQPRDYVGQAAAILAWVQNNIYYVNEPGERLQAPLLTLKIGYGDCDDLAMLCNAMFDSIRLDYRYVICGKTPDGRLVRYVEGEDYLPQADWVHIYTMVGDKPFTPTNWYYVEPTMKVPLGWDVVSAGGKLPEMGDYGATPSRGAGTGIGIGVGTASVDRSPLANLGKEIGVAVVIGVFTALGTELFLDFIKSTDWYASKVSKRKNRG